MLDKKQLEDLAFISKIPLKEEHKSKLLEDMNEILESFKILNTFSIDACESQKDFTSIDDLPEEVIEPSLSVPSLKSLNKNFLDGYFSVPQILAGDEE